MGQFDELVKVRNYRCTGNPQLPAHAEVMGNYLLKTSAIPQNPCYDAGHICLARLHRSIRAGRMQISRFNRFGTARVARSPGMAQSRAGLTCVTENTLAEGTGLEPATGFPAPHFQCGR